ncbi:cation diffusion facilitator family transporter [Caballeronia sordidicola]|uniref:Cation diffusion facilitator family transporter n=1 Tax=Caballeronia sordidicola TaxID=196367 RepID=A0A158HM76_CABSO|nr:cation transporter [Caballeronia sordidicola]SAL45356.1 cation diffusion facilitator family transporter [Caballeronia sordidicola]
MPTVTAQPEQVSLRAARLGIATNVALMTIEIATGYLTGSHAIVADGIHTLVDLVIDAILFLPLWLSNRAGVAPPLAARRKAWLPSTAAAAVLMLVGGELIWQGLCATSTDGDISPPAQTAAIFIAILVICTREYVARHFHMAAGQLDPAETEAAGLLTAGAWHARADAVSAGAAAIGAAGTLGGIAHLDQLATLLIGSLMLAMGLLQEGNRIKAYYRRA